LAEQIRKCFFGAAESYTNIFTPECHQMADKKSILPTKGVLAETIKNAKVPMPKGQKTFN
jgi:hypothetical protein